MQHPWFVHAGASGDDDEDAAVAADMSHVVARLEAFAGMSRMKRLALAVLCHTVTDRHVTRLKVRWAGGADAVAASVLQLVLSRGQSAHTHVHVRVRLPLSTPTHLQSTALRAPPCRRPSIRWTRTATAT